MGYIDFSSRTIWDFIYNEHCFRDVPDIPLQRGEFSTSLFQRYKLFPLSLEWTLFLR